MRIIPRRVTKVLMVVWLFATTMVAAITIARHTVALPVASIDDPALRTAMLRLRTPGDDRAIVVHVLSADCRCSRRIAAHLVEAARPADAREVVLLLGHDDGLVARLRAHSFDVRETDERTIADTFGLRGAPSFVVLSRSGELRYVGGYTSEKQGASPRDVEIIEATRTAVVPSIPVLGCAVTNADRRRIDPTGVL